MLKKKIIVAVFGALMFNPVILPQNNFLPVSVVCAEVQTIEADGYYTMGDGLDENQGVAKERARESAKRAASEQACTFIESISEIKNGNLTRDEIRSFSASVLNVIDSPVKIETNGDSIVFHCHITVTVDTDNVDKILQDKQKFDKLMRQNKEKDAEIARLNAEMDAMKKKFATASDEEKKEITAEVKQNEEQFKAVQLVDEGWLYFVTDDNQKALENFNKAIELNPKYSQAWSGLGSIYSILNDYNKSIEYFNKAIEFDEKDDYALFGIGWAYYDLKNYDKAIEYFNKSVELNPQNSSNWFSLATTYRICEDYDKAIEYFNKAIEIDSKDDMSWNQMGLAYGSLKKYDKAIECFNKAIFLK